MKYYVFIVLTLHLVSCKQAMHLQENVVSFKITNNIRYSSDSTTKLLGDTIVITDKEVIQGLLKKMNDNKIEFAIFLDHYKVIIQYPDSTVNIGINGNGIRINGQVCRTKSNIETLLNKYMTK